LKVVNVDKAILEMRFREGHGTEPLLTAGVALENIEGSGKPFESARERFGDKRKVDRS